MTEKRQTGKLEIYIQRFIITQNVSPFYIPLFRFGETSLTYDESAHNTILDYVVKVKTLDEYDRIVQYAGTNYSVTGNY